MGTRIDMIGFKVGRLLVVEEAPPKIYNYGAKGERRFFHWLCQCECGNKVSVRGAHLRKGLVRSCGCLAKELASERMKNQKYSALAPGEAATNQVVADYKLRAKRLGIEFSLDEGVFRTLIFQNCFYCGSPPSNESKALGGNVFYNGIDRIDNDFGYIEGNVVPSCAICNIAKNDVNQEEFKNWIKRVFHTWASR